MTTALDDIVKVTITKESSAIDRLGFATPAFVTEHTNFAERLKVYEGSEILTDIVGDGFATTDPAYKMAAAAVSQTPRLSRIALGREAVGDADLTATMVAIVGEAGASEKFYGFAHESRVEADVLMLAAWAETTNKIFFAQTLDAAVPAETAGNVLEDLNGFAYARTALTVRPSTLTPEDYGECAALARILAADLDQPGGAADLAHKTLAGIAPNGWTGAQRTYIHGLHGNTYESRFGKQFFFPGDMAGGRAIDEVIAIDWLDQRMTEDVFAVLTGTSTKIPFTQAGIDVIEGVVRARLLIAVANGILASFEIKSVKIEETQASDREARLLRTIQWTGILAGAIRKVQIVGKVSV